MPAGNAPFALAGVVAPFDKYDFAILDYDYADAYDWLSRVHPCHKLTVPTKYSKGFLKTSMETKTEKNKQKRGEIAEVTRTSTLQLA